MTDVPADHSVTCALCGDLADERRTVNLTTDEDEVGGALRAENPERFAAIRAAVDQVGEGEAHEDCLQRYKESLPDAVGQLVVGVRGMTDEEMEAFGIPADRLHGAPSVLVLEDGTTIFPSAGSEGNAYGALFGIDEDGDLFGYATPSE